MDEAGTAGRSTAPPTVLAVDLGTGGPKTALVALDGEVLASVHRRVEPAGRC